jgi:hypothetical protein
VSLDVRTPFHGRSPAAGATAHPGAGAAGPSHAHVVAVLVGTGDALADLRRVVQSQTRLPDLVVPVEDAPDLGPASDRVIATALDAIAKNADAATQEPGDAWLWLLPAGADPAPDALERLLEAVELGPSIGVAGCKQRDSRDRRLLVQTGFTTTRLGRQLTGVDRGDVDQGQLDHREDVLAVSTTGVLVRSELARQLRGTDPALTGRAADLDFCKRAHLTGHRVVVVPRAVVHAPAPPRVSRREATHLRLAHVPMPLLPLVAVALVLGGMARLLLRVGAKDPGRGFADLGGTLAAFSRPDKLWRSRRRGARTRRVPRRTLNPLLAGHKETSQWHRDRWHQRRALVSGRTQTGGASIAMPARRGGRSRWVLPIVVLAAFTAVSLTALHRLIGPGTVSGGALSPAPDSVRELAKALGSTWRPSGLGGHGVAEPFHAVLVALSGLAGGSPRLAVAVTGLAALPVAALGAWLATGRGTHSRWLRAWATLTWVAAPALLIATGTGRLGAVLAHVALPYVVWAVLGTVQSPLLRYAWTPAAAGGLVLAVAVAGAPVLLAPAVLALLTVAAVYRTRALPLIWTGLPSLVLLGPWVADALRNGPRALLSGPDLPLAFAPASGWQQLLGQPVAPQSWPVLDGLLSGTAALAVPLVASGLVVLLALVALLRGGARGRAVRVGWTVALLGLAAAGLATHVFVADDATQLVRGWPGGALSLALAGLLVAAVAAGDGLGSRLRSADLTGWRRVSARGSLVAVSVVALLAPLAALGAWTWQTTTDTGASLLGRDTQASLPKVAVDAARSGDRTRTLVLRSTADGVNANLVRGSGPGPQDYSSLLAAERIDGRLGSAAPADPDAADQALDEAVAALAAGRVDPRPALAGLGVGYVVVLPTAAEGKGGADAKRGDAGDPLVTALETAPGLVRSGQSASGQAWRVVPASGEGREGLDRPAAVRILDAEQRPIAVVDADPLGVDARIPAAKDAKSTRVLVLAERAHSGWVARLDGRRLTPAVHDGWAQAFQLPAQGGHLVVEHVERWQAPWRTAQIVVGVLTVLLAVPLPKTRAMRRTR